ncbi:hypothetical protein [Nocardioides ganghwensis]|jgi:hypothetical protein|uniref:Uncharacterized protein n=1 Tax=Nocardioides ganghwensis TaxID=252230 RepID=A0A4Q2S9I1_9ACTN|nr:hypothetical protein [Nocardioides ganghwensis]MBD3948070.1 hypothetical protein [Nocardioides ganghwensis]RYB97314.1 hypothetical protein EUA07_20530 [Nocardioides ganghwensis]
MLSRHGARLAAFLAPVALLLPTAAHADQVTVDDAAGDAKAINFGSELAGFLFGSEVEGQPLFLDAPAEAATDITRTTIQHGRRITITTHFRDLVETAEHSVEMRVLVPRGRFDLSVGRSADGSGYAQLAPRMVFTEDGDVRPRLCRSVRGRYDVAAETVTVSFPAACIGKPRWVQVTSVASRIQVTPIGDGSVNLAGWADDAFRSSLSEKSMGRSPKVRRG